MIVNKPKVDLDFFQKLYKKISRFKKKIISLKLIHKRTLNNNYTRELDITLLSKILRC
jgi:hypothetical protein